MNTHTPGISQIREVEPIRPTAEMTIHLTPFDRKEYRQLIETRSKTMRDIVGKLCIQMRVIDGYGGEAGERGG